MKPNVIHFESRTDAAIFTLATYGREASFAPDGQPIAAPNGRYFDTPGPLRRELVICTITGAFVVHQTLNGWLGAHVMTLRFPTPPAPASPASSSIRTATAGNTGLLPAAPTTKEAA